MIVEYDNDGRITHIISDPVPEHMAAFLQEQGSTFLDLPFDHPQVRIIEDYVSDGEMKPRPDCPARVTVDGRVVSLADVPEGSTVSVWVEGVEFPLTDDGDIELDEAGPVTVVVSPPWPYLEGRHDLEIE